MRRATGRINGETEPSTFFSARPTILRSPVLRYFIPTGHPRWQLRSRGLGPIKRNRFDCAKWCDCRPTNERKGRWNHTALRVACCDVMWIPYVRTYSNLFRRYSIVQRLHSGFDASTFAVLKGTHQIILVKIREPYTLISVRHTYDVHTVVALRLCSPTSSPTVPDETNRWWRWWWYCPTTRVD